MYRAVLMSCALLFPALAGAQQAASARPAITGISGVTFYADNLAKSQQFYASLIGWQQVPAGTPASGVRFYANHSQYIQLLSPPTQGLEDRLVSVGLATTSAESMRRFLSAHSVAVPPSVTLEPDGGATFQVKDPEGHTIEFTQEGPYGAGVPRPSSTPVSNQIVHAGFVVRDRGAMDRFYKDLLGFHLYWQGGSSAGRTDWVMMQVPNGTDWVEYMLNLPLTPSRSQLGSANHFSPDVVSVTVLQENLKQRGWIPTAKDRPPVLGVDGKWQLDLLDPDGTRVEFMEFKEVKQPCCSPILGTPPTPSSGW